MPSSASSTARSTSCRRAPCMGTSSLRRQAQVLRLPPRSRVVPLRGNVETRLRKLDGGRGRRDVPRLRRARTASGLASTSRSRMTPDEMLPAVAQGAIGIEIRAEDAETARLLAPINRRATALCVPAERAFLAKLEGSCRTPIAGLAELARHDVSACAARSSRRTAAGATHARRRPAQAALRSAEDAAAELLGHAGPDFLLART